VLPEAGAAMRAPPRRPKASPGQCAGCPAAVTSPVAGGAGPVVVAQPPGGGQISDPLPGALARPRACLTAGVTSPAANWVGAAVPGQRAGCTGRSRCCAISARRSASSCSSSARVRRRSSKARHRSCWVCLLPGSVPLAAGAGAPHRHPQVAGGSIPAANVTVNACPRAHRYTACWRETGRAPGRSAIPAPAPGTDRRCRGMIMNSPGPARQASACPA
jgi:hypothetical protein